MCGGVTGVVCVCVGDGGGRMGTEIICQHSLILTFKALNIMEKREDDGARGMLVDEDELSSLKDAIWFVWHVWHSATSEFPAQPRTLRHRC